MPQARETDPALHRAIDSADALWQEGNKEWFGLLADDVIVYAVASVEPFEGREAYEAHFGGRLTGGKRTATPLARDIQMLEDDSAVVAQTIEIQEDGIVANIRQSVIWRKADKGDWKIKHLHTTLLGQPVPAGGAAAMKTASGIKVLNEKIATMAAVLGVAQ